MPGLTLRVEGLDALLKKLPKQALYGEPLRKALDKSAQIAAQLARGRSPRRSGALAASIKPIVDRRPVPTYAKVTANVTSRGVRYGFVLDASRRRVYHYAGTNRPTRGWFSGVLPLIRTRVEALIAGAAREIEQRWGR